MAAGVAGAHDRGRGRRESCQAPVDLRAAAGEVPGVQVGEVAPGLVDRPRCRALLGPRLRPEEDVAAAACGQREGGRRADAPPGRGKKRLLTRPGPSGTRRTSSQPRQPPAAGRRTRASPRWAPPSTAGGCGDIHRGVGTVAGRAAAAAAHRGDVHGGRLRLGDAVRAGDVGKVGLLLLERLVAVALQGLQGAGVEDAVHRARHGGVDGPAGAAALTDRQVVDHGEAGVLAVAQHGVPCLGRRQRPPLHAEKEHAPARQVRSQVRVVLHAVGEGNGQQDVGVGQGAAGGAALAVGVQAYGRCATLPAAAGRAVTRARHRRLIERRMHHGRRHPAPGPRSARSRGDRSAWPRSSAWQTLPLRGFTPLLKTLTP